MIRRDRIVFWVADLHLPGEGKRYAGIQNQLFYAENCNRVYGDAQAVLVKMIEAGRGLG